MSIEKAFFRFDSLFLLISPPASWSLAGGNFFAETGVMSPASGGGHNRTEHRQAGPLPGANFSGTAVLPPPEAGVQQKKPGRLVPCRGQFFPEQLLYPRRRRGQNRKGTGRLAPCRGQFLFSGIVFPALLSTVKSRLRLPFPFFLHCRQDCAKLGTGREECDRPWMRTGTVCRNTRNAVLQSCRN